MLGCASRDERYVGQKAVEGGHSASVWRQGRSGRPYYYGPAGKTYIDPSEVTPARGTAGRHRS